MTDADEQALNARVKRIIDEALGLSEEAIRIRNENRAALDRLREEHARLASASARLSSTRFPSVPVSLIEWARNEVHRHPFAKDEHIIMGTVQLGELREFVKEVDRE